MIDFKGKYIGIAKNLTDNKIELCLEIAEPEKAKIIDNELTGKGALTVEIKKYRKKRSLDANAYFWVLVDKLARKTGIDKLTIYRDAIKEIGVLRQVEISENAVDTLIHSWSLHGLGWVAEKLDYSKNKGFVLINLYYGSSTYNTKQMSLLIDNIVQDCKAVGIETMTPAELAVLKDAWEKEKKREHNNFNGKTCEKS